MSLVKQAARFVLFLQALNNFIVGSWSIGNPAGFAAALEFQNADQKAVQSIGNILVTLFPPALTPSGLGALAVGAYGAAGAYANLRGFYAITAGLRLLFALIIFNQWGLEGNGVVILYECCVSIAAAIAASI